MSELFCPFSLTQVSGAFDCPRGQPVARRSGPDVACDDAGAHARCAELFAVLKAAALPSFGTVDDPTIMPHGVLVRIQHGGLLGLARALDPRAERVADIDALVARVRSATGEMPEISSDVLEAMHSFHLRRRRGR
ncbi:MAG: hypothetical protein LJE84_11505 [Gammaproteobacteria bacterium]|jgi:hypothetical protein|nr:hypothetical protein [Gammaproteobacteria bacterium]